MKIEHARDVLVEIPPDKECLTRQEVAIRRHVRDILGMVQDQVDRWKYKDFLPEGDERWVHVGWVSDRLNDVQREILHRIQVVHGFETRIVPRSMYKRLIGWFGERLVGFPDDGARLLVHWYDPGAAHVQE